jgi:hypothetical protein
MKFFSLYFLIGLMTFMISNVSCQTLNFGQLNGNPVNTTGWNMTGNASVNNDEIILSPNVLNQSGTIYFDKAVDLGLCPQFTVEFEFRMFGQQGADGMVFCFLNQAPTGFAIGNVLGVPTTAAGLKVAFDTWDNGCNGPNGVNTSLVPSIQILNGPNGYDECNPSIVRRNNNGGDLSFMRKATYTRARIVYNNGLVEVWLSKPTIFNPSPPLTLFLSTTLSNPINYAGYFGFSASTGGVSDKHSIKNVNIFSNAVPSIAGSDLTTCAGQANVLGTSPNTTHSYSWSPATGLNQTNISNPTATISNTSNAPITNQYIVTTYATTFGTACVTKDTVLITTNPSFNGTQNASFCIGDSYVLGGQTFTSPGTHVVTLQSQYNCDSTITLNLTANPSPNSVLNQSICFGSSYSFNGNNYTNSGTYYATFPMSLGCDSVATLNLTVRPFVNSTDVATICQGDSYSFGGTNYTTSGTYPHTFSGPNGCDSLVTLELTVVNSFSSTFSPVICQGDSYVFDGQTYTASGTHVATLQTLNGCDSVVTMNLTVNPNYNQTVNQSICTGQSYTFNNQSYSSAGTYTANLQSVSGCDSIVTLNLTVSTTILSNLNQTICQGDSYSFNNQNLNTSGTYTGNFVSTGGCDSIVTLNLSIVPNFSITQNKIICQGESYTLNGILYTVTGTYTANLQTISGCDSIITLNLTVTPAPVKPDFTSNSPLACPGDIFVLQVVNPESTGTYLWTGPNNFSAQGNTASLKTKGSSEGNYSLVFQQNGCNSIAATGVLQINGAEVANFDLPNVITPNGDLINDELDIDQFFNACIPYELTISNRWGNPIYTQKQGEKPFSGIDKSGIKVTEGVYFYQLIYGGEVRQGSITIVY